MLKARMIATTTIVAGNTSRLSGLENNAARESSFCKSSARMMHNPRNRKPTVTYTLVHEELRMPCAVILSHSLWRGLTYPRWFSFRSSSVKSNRFIYYLLLDFPFYGTVHLTPSTSKTLSSSDHLMTGYTHSVVTSNLPTIFTSPAKEITTS